MLNKRFEEWGKHTVGERAYIELKETNGYRLAIKQFDENIKPAFRSRDDEDQYVNFPMANLKDNPAKMIKSNCITLTGRAHSLIFLESCLSNEALGTLYTISLDLFSERSTSLLRNKSIWSMSSV